MVRIFPFRLISRPASPDCFHSEMLYLADPDTCGADGFHEQGQAFPALAAGGREEGGHTRRGSAPCGFPEHAPLDAQRLYPASVPAKKREKNGLTAPIWYLRFLARNPLASR